MLAASYSRTEQGVIARRKMAEMQRLTLLAETVSLQRPVAVEKQGLPPFVNNVITLRIKQEYRPSIKVIATRICRVFGYSMAEIRSDRRDRRLVFARQAICYWVRRLTGHSLPLIGRHVGGRDHTTILHAISAYPRKRATVGRNLAALSNRVERSK